MKVNAVFNQSQVNFNAKANLKYPYVDMLNFAPIKSLDMQLRKSPTNNIYEIGKTTYSNGTKKLCKHAVLLNGEKFADVVQKKTDGVFGFVKKFMEKCVEKENMIAKK